MSSAAGRPTSATARSRAGGRCRSRRSRAEDEVRVERHAEPGAADGDGQVGGAAREPERAHGADDQQRQEPPPTKSRPARAATWPSARPGRLRERAARSGPKAMNAGEQRRPGATSGRDVAGRRSAGSAVSASRNTPAGTERPPASGDHAVLAHEEPGRRERVDGEQRRHRRERGAHQDRAAVAGAGAGDAQQQRRERRQRGGAADQGRSAASAVSIAGRVPISATRTIGASAARSVTSEDEPGPGHGPGYRPRRRN